MKIQLAQPEDANAVYTIFRKTWIDTYPNEEFDITVEDIESKFNKSEKAQKIEKYSEFYARMNSDLDTVNTLVWVMRLEDKTVGLISINKEDPINLGALYVIPKFQNKGLGKNLMEFILSKYGAKVLSVKMSSYNLKAIEFYKKFGFREYKDLGLVDVGLESGKKMPEIEMRREP